MEAAREQGRGDGGARVAFLLAWSLAGLCVAMFVATFPLVGALIASRRTQNPIGWILLADGLLWIRDETDLDSLSEDLVGVVRETVRPAQVSLWLRPFGRIGTNEESRTR